MSIPIRNAGEIDKLHNASKIVGNTLAYIKDFVKPGVSLLELDSLVEEHIVSFGARPSFKGLYGFPHAACISVNEVIIHGIPSSYCLKEGDIVGIDIGSELDGWYGDGAITLSVGDTDSQSKALIACAKDSLMYAISEIRDGMYFKELSKIIEDFILARGFVPLRDYCGHGIGRKPHDEPMIMNYLDSNNAKQGPKIRNGMVFCIEPMICVESGKPKVLSDGWGVVSEDGFRGAHYEHTVAVINGRAKILTENK